GTATAGADYASAAGVLTFTPGVTSQTFAVFITNDALDEPNETVNLTLSGPVNATLGAPNPGTLAIVDNDTSLVFLPLLVKDFVAYFEGPGEIEPNDSYLQANGPLRSGTNYSGLHNGGANVDRDYFSIYLRTAGQITIDLTGIITGQAAQLHLYYQSATLANRKGFDSTPPYHIQYTGQAGWYYILVFTPSGYSSTVPYTLKATFPFP
ncbi:MAG: Calx-beta domain-containing protein, partial [Anaerolineae bacterium]